MSRGFKLFGTERENKIRLTYYQQRLRNYYTSTRIIYFYKTRQWRRPRVASCSSFSRLGIKNHTFTMRRQRAFQVPPLFYYTQLYIITMKGQSFRIMRFALSSTLSIPWLALLLLAFGRLQVPTFVVDNSGILLQPAANPECNLDGTYVNSDLK